MTTRIRRIPARTPDTGLRRTARTPNLPGRRSRRRERTNTARSPMDTAGHARFYAVRRTCAGVLSLPRPARLVSNTESSARDRVRAGDGCTPDAFSSGTRSRRSVTSRAPTRSACACSLVDCQAEIEKVGGSRRAEEWDDEYTIEGGGGGVALSRKIRNDELHGGGRCSNTRSRNGLEPYGVSSMSSSKQRPTRHAWDRALPLGAGRFGRESAASAASTCRWSISRCEGFRPST